MEGPDCRMQNTGCRVDGVNRAFLALVPGTWGAPRQALLTAVRLRHVKTLREGERRMNTDRVEDELLALERRIMDAIRAKDIAGLRSLLAESFVYRNPASADAHLEDFLESVASLPVTVLSLSGEAVQAAVFGETAVLTGVQIAVTRQGEDAPATSRGAFTDVFIRQAGQWRLALAYAVDLPSGPESKTEN
jgi:ketosteroid isomerase-like protein